jgi:hypothetical protein
VDFPPGGSRARVINDVYEGLADNGDQVTAVREIRCILACWHGCFLAVFLVLL